MKFAIPTNEVSIKPKIEPVTVDEVKANCANAFIDTSTENDFIASLIPAARAMVENLAGRSLITQTRKQYYDCMPSPPVWLRYGPVQSVSSFAYTDSNQTAQTMSSALYDVDTSRIQARIDVGYGDTWETAIEKTNSITITYVAGYGATGAAVPIMYRRAIIVLCGHWYENRDQIGCEGDDMAMRVIDMLAIEGRTLEYA